MTPERPQTAPHDYRVVCECKPAPTVVGGQAVNLWAIVYLTPEVARADLVSKDLDIVVTPDSFAQLKNVPGWVFQKKDLRNWMDSRLGALRGTSPDGRPLLVEILHSVHGLVESDLEASAYVEFEGAVFRVLDPIAVLKAKAMNVRDIDQDGPSPRQDRLHLHLIARCVPEFLRDVHQSAVADPTKVKQSLEVFSRAFRTLQNKKIATTLIAEGIAPRSLLPPEFSESPLDRIRRAYQWQMKMVPEGTQQTQPFADTASSVAVRPTEGRGPKIGM